MSMFAKYYQTKNVCYDSDYDENDFQAPDEDDEPDTLDESVPSEFMFSKQHTINTEQYPELIPKFPYVQAEEGFYICKSCDWYEEMSWNCNEYISHINHGYSCCKYIKSKYDISYDDEGYIVGTEQKVASKVKKPTKKQPKKMVNLIFVADTEKGSKNAVVSIVRAILKMFVLLITGMQQN